MRTEPVADKELFAYIGLPAPETVDAEVRRVIERSSVPGVEGTVELHLLGNGGRVLAEEPGDAFEGYAFVERQLNELAVLQSEVFLVSRYKF